VNHDWEVGQSVEVGYGGDEDGGGCGDGDQSAIANWRED
jgi:hypothetical protein